MLKKFYRESMENKDLRVKIGSKDEVLWTKVKKEAEMLIEQSEDNLKIQREILKLAIKMIETHKLKQKTLNSYYLY